MFNESHKWMGLIGSLAMITMLLIILISNSLQPKSAEFDTYFVGTADQKSAKYADFDSRKNYIQNTGLLLLVLPAVGVFYFANMFGKDKK